MEDQINGHSDLNSSATPSNVVIEEREKKRARTFPFYKFSFADSTDIILIIVGTFGAIENGAPLPLMTVLFGVLMDFFGEAAEKNDGFTLSDLVTYNDKHNLLNGKDNNDGKNHNLSWNCGEVIPLRFSREQLPPSRPKIVLRGLCGKAWPVVYTSCWKDYLLPTGWSNFACGNNFREGDYCAFEFASKEELSDYNGMITGQRCQTGHNQADLLPS